MLASGPLAGRVVSAVDIGTNEPPVLVIACHPAEIVPAWKAARDVVALTGRWPVAITNWGATGLLDAALFSTGATETCAVAETVDVDAAMAELTATVDAFRWGEWDEMVRFEVSGTTDTFSRGPGFDELTAALGDSPGLLSLDRWLFAWEQREEANGAAADPPDTRYLDFFIPPAGQACGIAFLPTPHAWQTVAWLPFWGACDPPECARLIAVMRRWHDQWGAELVAHWSTMLEFVVTRPPTTSAEAYPIALGHHLLAGATLAGVSVRQHARVIVNRPTWFLHNRP